MKKNMPIKNQAVYICQQKILTITIFFTILIYLFSLRIFITSNNLMLTNHAPIFKNIKINQNRNLIIPENLKSNLNTTNITTYIRTHDQLVARHVDRNSIHSYISNTKKSVLKLKNHTTENIISYQYNAYGHVLEQQSNIIRHINNIPNSFMYNGERHDLNTGLLHLRARFYNTYTKRFINQDSYNLLNRFLYANANPIIFIDPNGHESFNPFSADWWKNIFSSDSSIAQKAIGATTILAGATILATMSVLVIKGVSKLKNNIETNDALKWTIDFHYGAIQKIHKSNDIDNIGKIGGDGIGELFLHKQSNELNRIVPELSGKNIPNKLKRINNKESLDAYFALWFENEEKINNFSQEKYGNEFVPIDAITTFATFVAAKHSENFLLSNKNNHAT